MVLKNFFKVIEKLVKTPRVLSLYGYRNFGENGEKPISNHFFANPGTLLKFFDENKTIHDAEYIELERKQYEHGGLISEPVKRSELRRKTCDLNSKIRDYKRKDCYIPTYGNCFSKSLLMF